MAHTEAMRRAEWVDRDALTYLNCRFIYRSICDSGPVNVPPATGLDG
jgi:hypothetical protein